MKFKQTDCTCTFPFKKIFAENILYSIRINHNCGQFIVRHFQSPLVYVLMALVGQVTCTFCEEWSFRKNVNCFLCSVYNKIMINI